MENVGIVIGRENKPKILDFGSKCLIPTKDIIFLNNYLPSHIQSIIKKEKRSSLLTKILDDKKIVDVFGSEKEPICNYLRCHHKFSLHGSKARKKICTCRHPQNSIIGIAKRIQAM